MKILTIVYRGLIVFLIVLAAALIGGTVYGLIFNNILSGHSQDGQYKGQTFTEQQQHKQQKGQKGQTFTGIGQIRVPTADPQPGMVILFVSFVYYPDDLAFSEELVFRVREFRDIVREYIGSFSVSELEIASEETMKAEILRQFNAILRLGKLDALFFSDFLIVR